MVADETLKKIKTSIRITHNVLDDEVKSDIEACKANLRTHGILVTDESDPLIYNAIKLYCKAEYTDDPDKSAMYRDSYVSLRDSLKMAEGYGWEEWANE